ncbi:MAG: threonylcarbamoyl-AMP synthase [Chloroflexi bacterium]|nr:threonylcarbamoyl-AMP synthase [Chloroflexota bacterium]
MPDKPPLDMQPQIEKGISILRQGGLVAYPTDTVYGLGVCPGFPQSVERVYKVKQRPQNMPLPLLLTDTSQLTMIAATVPPAAWRLIHRFLPGALTLVLAASSSAPSTVTAGGATVAIRIPAHPIAVALAAALGGTIVGTSANLSGRPSPLTAEEVYRQLGDKIDFVIDGGRCPGGKESTIVDVTGETPVILREGAISREELEQVCGRIVLKEGD